MSAAKAAAELSAALGEVDGPVRQRVWEDPFLLITSENKFGRRGRLYKGPGAAPKIIAAGWDYGQSVSDNLPASVASWMPNENPPPKATQLLQRLRGEPEPPVTSSGAASLIAKDR